MELRDKRGTGRSWREGWEPVGQSARLTPSVPTTLGAPSASNPLTFFTLFTQREKGAAWGKVSNAVVFDFNSHPASITWHRRSGVTGGTAVCCVNTRTLLPPESLMQRIFPNSQPSAHSYTQGMKSRLPTTRHNLLCYYLLDMTRARMDTIWKCLSVCLKVKIFLWKMFRSNTSRKWGVSL